MDMLPGRFADTRHALQRVAVHVVARRRHQLVGRFGLRATPGGFGSPAAGPDHEVLRTAGASLLRERTGATAATTAIDLRTASLVEVAGFAGVDLTAPFDVGHDTPPVGDVEAPLAVDQAAALALGGWYTYGWTVLDDAVAALGHAAAASVVQLWPEHFDAGVDVEVAPDVRVNLGASPGDGGHPEPYLYVGPWTDDRPGDPAYWNAPFGAMVAHAELRASGDPHAAGLAFLREGLDRLSSAGSSS